MTSHDRRIVPLEGGCNFRDLGGYRATDGRQIRFGKLYRSGVMSYFTPADTQPLRELGIHTICDLQRKDERQREPTRWPTEVSVHYWDNEADQDPSDKSAFGDMRTESHAHDFMMALYRSLPVTMSRRLEGIFEKMTEGNTPLVFHCSAGKDRTGLSAALVLYALEVPMQTIFADYELTNSAVDLSDFIVGRRAATMGIADTQHPLALAPSAVRNHVLTANPKFLSAAFERISELHGTIDAYLHSQLGVDETAKTALRDAYLI